MDLNTKDVSTYIEGVPVKISSKFLPPKPISLPYAYEVSPNLEILNNLYDFSLEKNVIENHTRRLLQLEENKNCEPKENVSSDMGSDSASNENVNQQDPSLPSLSTNAQNVLSWQPDSILLPKPNQPLAVSSEGTSQQNHFKINLSDFENDTSSPFDYMELQTINDLEELNSVFQGINVNRPTNEPNTVNNCADVSANVSKSKSFPLPSNSGEIDMERGASFSASSFELPHQSSTRKHVDDFPSYSNMKFSQVPCISSNAGTHVSLPPFTQLPYLRSSKSYSDISNLGNSETAYSDKGRSLTPPSTFSYSTVPDQRETQSEVVATSNGNCDNDLPDPYHELESELQNFVDSITEMGFSRPQVARTVKHLGTDEKKVVEHLCQIQALEESGYNGIEAEAALHLHDYNSEEAKMFLDLVSQFQDLGFEKKAVKKALVQNKNDWNKTIDALLL